MSSQEPYWTDGQVTLYLGDFREVLPILGITPDLVVADPPYGETALAWDRWPDGWPSLVAACGARSMWCFGSMRMFLDRRDEFADWKLSQDIVWEKEHGSGIAKDRFRRVHEFATHWYRGNWREIHHETPRIRYDGPDSRHGYTRPSSAGAGTAPHTGATRGYTWVDNGTRLMRSVIKARSMWRRGAISATEKPTEVLAPMLSYGCPPGGLVVDIFAGSCSTLMAARGLGLRAIGIERREDQCEKAVIHRLSQDGLRLEGIA